MVRRIALEPITFGSGVTPSVWDLKEIAWALVTDKRNLIGFVPRKDWSEALKREVDDLDDQK